jgi:hypothetical protein
VTGASVDRDTAQPPEEKTEGAFEEGVLAYIVGFQFSGTFHQHTEREIECGSVWSYCNNNLAEV